MTQPPSYVVPRVGRHRAANTATQADASSQIRPGDVCDHSTPWPHGTVHTHGDRWYDHANQPIPAPPADANVSTERCPACSSAVRTVRRAVHLDPIGITCRNGWHGDFQGHAALCDTVATGRPPCTCGAVVDPANRADSAPLGDDVPDVEDPRPSAVTHVRDCEMNRWYGDLTCTCGAVAGAAVRAECDRNGAPMPVPNDQPSIHDLVVKDVQDRKELGLRRYGSLLQAGNGRNALQDLYEELLDAACYARQRLAEEPRPATVAAPPSTQRDAPVALAVECTTCSDRYASLVNAVAHETLSGERCTSTSYAIVRDGVRSAPTA